MKKKELVKKYKRLEGVWDAPGAETARQIFLQDLEQLDEPEKVKVPWFVEEYIKWAKKEDFHLLGAMNRENFDKKLYDWFYTDDNIEVFARAWLDGYEVGEEKRYTVVMKETKQPLYYNAGDKKLFFSLGGLATNFTQKQLEKAGFGWVFDCPGIEIEEVKKELNNDQ